VIQLRLVRLLPGISWSERLSDQGTTARPARQAIRLYHVPNGNDRAIVAGRRWVAGMASGIGPHKKGGTALVAAVRRSQSTRPSARIFISIGQDRAQEGLPRDSL